MEVVPSMVVQTAVDAIGGGGGGGGGVNPRIFGRKKLTMSDCNDRQNRFLFRDENVRNFILPQLNEEEMERAHLPLGINLNDDPNLRDLGLPVDLYMINTGLEKFQTVLIRRLSTGVVLKGHDWKRVVPAGNLAPGDDVILWAFRRVDNDKLCLLIQKIH